MGSNFQYLRPRSVGGLEPKVADFRVPEILTPKKGAIFWCFHKKRKEKRRRKRKEKKEKRRKKIREKEKKERKRKEKNGEKLDKGF